MRSFLVAMAVMAVIAAWSSSAAAQITILPADPPPSLKQADNVEVTTLFAADQADRTGEQIDWAIVAPRDEVRRKALRGLMDAGGLVTGKDYEHASFIFQHGQAPEDFLLAHVLAETAVARGDGDAIWIAAATLDRFLANIGRKQIFGTQFSTPMPPLSQVATQEPYDRLLVSDAIRRANRIQPQREQERLRREMSKAQGVP